MARILIVEDETSQRFLMNELLTRAGHEARAAKGPEDAAEVAESFRPEVVISDWRTAADRTGLEAAEALRGRQPAVGLIFVTPQSLDSLESEAQHLHPFQVVNQPWGSQDLLGAVHAVLH
jgi:DNA-binding NtrC family response regulator